MRTKILTDLIKDIPCEAKGIDGNLIISQIEFDSRKIKPGALFIAVRGFKSDGHQFLEKAKQAGAVAAMVESINPDIDLPQIKVSNSRQVLAQLANRFYSPEIGNVDLIGITGTNGKTTTSYLVRAILAADGRSSGLIGTIAHHFGNEQTDAQNTTPEAVDICYMIFKMEEAGQKACVMEVSSHALSLQRVSALRFRAAVFTNLTRDHMDFYKDEEEYFKAKAMLFEQLKSGGRAIVNVDDPYGMRLLREKTMDAITFGFSQQAMIRAVDWKLESSFMNVVLTTPEGQLNIRSRLISEFNVQNIMAAVATGIALGIKPEALKKGIENVSNVPGRLETYELKPGVLGIIDYAHTPDALQKALQALRPMTDRQLHVLFGCGGDRDRGKRPQMGKIAEQYADRIIVTTDNPRTEDPRKIMDDIVAGMSFPEKRRELIDRREAIHLVVKQAKPGDVILIAGKGHEKYQEIHGVKYDFDEASILIEAAKHA